MIKASNNGTISGFENHVDVLRVPRAPYSLESRLDKCLKRLERCINEHQPDIRRPFWITPWYITEPQEPSFSSFYVFYPNILCMQTATAITLCDDPFLFGLWHLEIISCLWTHRGLRVFSSVSSGQEGGERNGGCWRGIEFREKDVSAYCVRCSNTE